MTRSINKLLNNRPNVVHTSEQFEHTLVSPMVSYMPLWITCRPEYGAFFCSYLNLILLLTSRIWL